MLAQTHYMKLAQTRCFYYTGKKVICPERMTLKNLFCDVHTHTHTHTHAHTHTHLRARQLSKHFPLRIICQFSNFYTKMNNIIFYNFFIYINCSIYLFDEILFRKRLFSFYFWNTFVTPNFETSTNFSNVKCIVITYKFIYAINWQNIYL